MVELSVCVPTYNGAAFLEKCLHSLLEQDCDFEIIVGDDASTDNTVAVARSIQDPRIKVHSFPSNIGLSANWSRTLALASGEYFSLVGQDDYVEPFWARRLLDLLRSEPRAHLAFGRRHFEFEDEESRAAVGDFFENRYPEMMAPFYNRIERVIEPKVMVEEAMRFSFEINLVGEPSFAMMRRDLPEVHTGFHDKMSQMIDWEFFTRFFVDRPVLHTDEKIGTYHIHARATSIRNSPLSKHYQEYDILLQTIHRRFGEVLTTEQKNQLERRHAEVLELRKTWAEKERQ